MAPELFYRNIGVVSFKAEVYSFGMLLMEMAYRQKNVNSQAENSSQVFFPTWIYDQFTLLVHLVFFSFPFFFSKVHSVKIHLMNKVVEMLEEELDILEMPPKPLLYPMKHR